MKKDEVKVSKLRGVIESTSTILDFETKKAEVLLQLETLEVYDSDRRKMTVAIMRTRKLVDLDRYLYNALLKFEGLGVI